MTGACLPPLFPGQRETCRVPRCGLGTRLAELRGDPLEPVSPRQGRRCRRTGGALSAAGPSLVGDCLLNDSIETSPTDHLTLNEDIAMTSAVLIMALSGVGLGHHGGVYATGQCPAAPSKCLPAPQAPCKTLPAPCKALPAAQAPCKAMPAPQAPCKAMPAPQAPCKVMPAPQAPCKTLPACHAPAKCLPTAQAPAKVIPAAQAPTKASPQW